MASKFQEQIIKKLEISGALVLKTIRLNKAGYPDIIAKYKDSNVVLWIEVKEDNDILSPLQKVRIDELNEFGYLACCIQKSKGIIYPENEQKVLTIKKHIDFFLS